MNHGVVYVEKNKQNFIQQTIFKEMAFASQLKVEE